MMLTIKDQFLQAQIDAEGKKCGRCGQEAEITCHTCERPLCAECVTEEECGEVLCGACGNAINLDVDTDFEEVGGGIHARCR